MQKSLKKSSLQDVLLDQDEEDQEGLGMTVIVSKVSLNIDQTFFHCCFGQGGRTWQPFVGSKMAMKIFVKLVFAIFASNALFLRVIANLQI